MYVREWTTFANMRAIVISDLLDFLTNTHHSWVKQNLLENKNWSRYFFCPYTDKKKRDNMIEKKKITS